jgi:ring-1,2-phenylacetyl-CoA epoxidase subunit PaaD
LITREQVETWLDEVADPEVPVLTVRDLGIIRDIIIHDDDSVDVHITPTYSGCPAMDMISTTIRMVLLSHGVAKVHIKEVLSPAWTTDWMSEEGKRKLNEYGIAPPQYSQENNPREEDAIVPCPLCHSKNTTLVSQFGSTACKALYKCADCLEPFDYFKCH